MICRDIGSASDLLSQLANPNRLALVCLLLDGERSVRTLEAALDIRQPTLSQQLGELRRAGIVAGRRHGRMVLYRVVDERAGRIVETLRALFAELLPASAILADADTPAGRVALAGARLSERESM